MPPMPQTKRRVGHSWPALVLLAVAGAALVQASSGTALGHKDKLPEDALSLVKQWAALLAQDPKMQGTP